MRSIFIDTGFIIALESVTDQNHEKASQLWSELMKELGSESALSFDKHFTQAGFKVLP